MIWSSRVVTLQARLGAKTALPQVETLGDFLGLGGRRVEAVRIFSATHHQARRVGKPWPRNPLTSVLLDRCRAALSSEQFDHAWAVGPTLSGLSPDPPTPFLRDGSRRHFKSTCCWAW
jgi:hypothetical protein